MLRRTPLRDRSREQRQAVIRDTPGRDAWVKPHYGPCASCGLDDRLIRHHILYLFHLKTEAPPERWFDLRNALDLSMWCKCHARQHSGSQRLPVSILPPAAHEFGIEVLGEGRWTLYVARYYADC